MKRTLLAAIPLLSLLAWVRAEEPVHFADARLKEAVEETLWISDPTPTDMLGLTDLICPNSEDRSNAISDLAGLEYAMNLHELDLRYHRISNLSALSGLSHLGTAVLLVNDIRDISPLSGLGNLHTLDLEGNEITGISALAGLSSLESVNFHRNCIRDISPLASLTHLKWVDLRVNPLNQDAYDVYLAQIEANNPGVRLVYDAFYNCRLVVSCTTGGSIIRPGQSEFTYPLCEQVVLEARADPCFEFTGWSGTLNSSDNPLLLVLNQDYHMQANFRSTLGTIHVDDDAPGDPEPGSAAVSDPQEDGTLAHPFDRIQEAIDIATDGASVFVHAGTFRETIDLLGKNITLTGFDPNDPNAAAWPVIDGRGAGPVVNLVSGERPTCILSGLVVTGGRGQSVAGLQCVASSPTMVNCLIVGNRTTDPNGTVVYCTNSDAAFVNCTISDNAVGEAGSALYVVDSCVLVLNSILWRNAAHEVASVGAGRAAVFYSDVEGGWDGTGCINVDPLFACAGHWAGPGDPNAVIGPEQDGAAWVMGDYHLQSQFGRWAPKAQTWVQDEATSLCIDAGDPGSPAGAEASPNGNIVNMGAFGGTAQASQSPGNADSL